MKKIIFMFLFFIWILPSSYGDENIKTPNVSGQFYSANSSELSQTIDAFLKAATVEPSDKKIAIVISPHAGYVYSGAVAAYGYKAVSKQRYRTIIIIAPSHFADFEGFAIWPQGAFTTPLGKVDVDSELSWKLMGLTEKIKFLPQAFEREHAVEVQIPFLQKTFKGYKIVPILAGRPNWDDCQILSSALHSAIGNRDDILIVVSTDMSHYHNDETARQMDNNSLSAIKSLDVDNFWSQSLLRRNMEMCGFVGTATALLYAKMSGINDISILKYANSGDVTGDRSSVVGYSSVIFYKEGEKKMEKQNEEVSPLTLEQKKRLLEIARKTMEAFIKKSQVLDFEETDPRLAYKEGAFVTIHKHGGLRGCIGNIIGDGPLYRTVRDMAIASSTKDPRFPPVTKEELGDLEIEISVLSEPKRTQDINEIKMGLHGVIISRDEFHRGVFLPQVATEQGWSKEEFLSNLCVHKAGLPPDAWKDPQTTIEIFTAQVFSEKDIAK